MYDYYVICPKCEARLRPTGDLFFERVQPSIMEVRVMGECERCGHKYTWTQRFNLIDEFDVEDDEDDE